MANTTDIRPLAQGAIDAYERHGHSWKKAAKELGVPVTTFQWRLQAARALGLKARDFAVATIPDEDISTAELLERRTRDFERRQLADDARKLIPIHINVKGPFAVAFFGDLHIDSPGCNLPLLRAHTELVAQTPYCYAIGVGDYQDSWIGRLAHLWAHQGVTAKQAKQLVEWWIDALKGKLLGLIDGNHDAWSAGIAGISATQWIASHVGVLSQTDGIRFELKSKDGSWTVNGRHDFPGRSQYNPAHALTKAALFGWRDDVLVAGHTHVSGYNVLKDPMTGRVSHALRIDSYKYIDPYAVTRGYPDQCIFECPIAIFDPTAVDPRYRVKIEFDPFHAVKVLHMMRSKEVSR